MIATDIDTTDRTASDSDRALARAVLCQALRAMLAAPQAPLLLSSAITAERRALLRAAELLDGGDGTLRSAVDVLLDRELDEPSLRSDCERLFGHSLRGVVCPYESEYGSLEVWQQAHELADLAGFYRAFGLAVAAGERVDHIACELEFLELLLLKEADARERDDREMVEVTRAATARFLRLHLGRFGPAFSRTLIEQTVSVAYAAVGVLLESFLHDLVEELGVSLGSRMLEVRPPQPDPTPMACDEGNELVQIGNPSSWPDGVDSA